MPVSEATYQQVALEDPDGKWELHCGVLRQKDGMTASHNSISRRLGFRLQAQLPLERFDVCVNNGQVRRPGGSYFIPDVMVVPRAFIEALRRDRPDQLEMYEQPLQLIVEIWSPSTGEYDRETKVP